MQPILEPCLFFEDLLTARVAPEVVAPGKIPITDIPTPQSGQRLAQLGDDIIGSAEHQALSLSSARQSIVLLNNPNSILPFKLT
jgi:beta-glucosidase-like glycosyl hydrolase